MKGLTGVPKCYSQVMIPGRDFWLLSFNIQNCSGRRHSVQCGLLRIAGAGLSSVPRANSSIGRHRRLRMQSTCCITDISNKCYGCFLIRWNFKRRTKSPDFQIINVKTRHNHTHGYKAQQLKAFKFRI